MKQTNLLVIGDPSAPYLRLDQLPAGILSTVGATAEKLRPVAAEADVVFVTTARNDVLSALWPEFRRVRWVHSLSAGVEGVLFPGLVSSDIPLTNGRGVFKESLGEFALAAILFFAKDLRRMVRNQEAHRWEQFDVEEIRKQTVGIVGYGEIGRAAARRAHALDMQVYALRRRAEAPEDPILSRAFPPAKLQEMLGAVDYLVVAAPLTSETRGLIGTAEFAAMKPGAVLINIGRGPVVEEAALVSALRERRIRGAALDVFDEEPLPESHPLWQLDNVLLSPHCADHTVTWLDEAFQFFLDNFHRFRNGEPLQNLVNKNAGY